MKTRTRASKSSSSRYYHDASFSRFLGSLQGMFHPSSANGPSVDRSAFRYSYPAKTRDFPGETATFKSVAQAVKNRNQEENDPKTAKLAKHGKMRKESKDGGPKEMRRNKDSLEADGAHNGTSERESYWKRRRKNNASAKKSRDARKARELQTKIKAAFLERENLRIVAQLMIVKQENASLKRVLWGN